MTTCSIRFKFLKKSNQSNLTNTWYKLYASIAMVTHAYAWVKQTRKTILSVQLYMYSVSAIFFQIYAPLDLLHHDKYDLQSPVFKRLTVNQKKKIKKWKFFAILPLQMKVKSAYFSTCLTQILMPLYLQL